MCVCMVDRGDALVAKSSEKGLFTLDGVAVVVDSNEVEAGDRPWLSTSHYRSSAVKSARSV